MRVYMESWQSGRENALDTPPSVGADAGIGPAASPRCRDGHVAKERGVLSP